MGNKPTLAELLADRLPDQPTHNLADEPWIDVCDPDGSNPRQVSLRDALADAHTHVLDAAACGPLWEHAATRLLIALTYLVRADAPQADWEDIARGREPLPAGAVDEVFERLHDRLWLHHPKHPFLQNLGVLEAMDGKPHKKPPQQLDNNTDPFWTLLPDVPSKSNVAWFGRHQDRPVPTWPAAAAAVLVRHYWALPGNEAPNRHAGGKTSKGGATGLTHQGRSFVTVAGPTLAARLVRNLLADWTATIGPDSPTYIDRPDAATEMLTAGPTKQPLWFYTATAAATVLVPAPDHHDRYRAVRSPAPAEKAVAEKLALGMAVNDPHGLRVDPKSKQQAAVKPYSMIRLPVTGSDLDLVQVFYRDLVDQGGALHDPSLLSAGALEVGSAGDTVDLLAIQGAGSSTGPRIAGTGTYRPPAGTFTISTTRAARYLELARTISGHKGAVSRKVGRRVHLALSENATSKAPDWLYPTCDQHVAAAAEPILRGLLKRCVDPNQTLPEELTETERDQVADIGLALFDRLLTPHANRPAAVARTVEQRRGLRRDLSNLTRGNR